MIGGELIEPGIYYDMPRQQYAKAEGLSAGSICRLLRKPLDYVDVYRRPHLYPDTPAKRLGKAMHSILLEPERFFEEYHVLPESDRRTNAGLDDLIQFYLDRSVASFADVDAHLASEQLEIAKQNGKRAALAYLEERSALNVLSPSDVETLEYLRESWNLPIHEATRNLFEGPTVNNEVSIFWRDEETGVTLKARLDRLFRLPSGINMVPDLKTAASADAGAFARAIPKFGYDVEATHFIEAVQAHKEGDVRFVFGVIETNAPFGAAAYRFSAPADILTGNLKRRHAIRLYKRCLDASEWPSYPNVIQPIEMPTWAQSATT